MLSPFLHFSDTVFLPWNVNNIQTLAHSKSTVASHYLYKSDGCKDFGDISTPTSSNIDPFEYDYTTSVSMRKDSSKSSPDTISDADKSSLKVPANIKGKNIPMAVYITQAETNEHY